MAADAARGHLPAGSLEQRQLEVARH